VSAYLTAEARDEPALRDWLAVRNAVRWRVPLALDEVVHQRAARPLRVDFVVRDPDGRPVGCARVGPHGWSDPADRLAGCDIFVLPEVRGRGIGTSLFAELSRRAAATLDAAKLETMIDLGDPDAQPFAERRGFVAVSKEQRVELDPQTADVGAPEPPDGVTLVPLGERRDLLPAIWEVDRECTADIPGEGGEQVPAFEVWLRDFESPSTFVAGSFIALDRHDAVIGFGALWRSADPLRGGNGMLAVTRAWRGRGVGGSIKRAQIVAARAHGMTSLLTFNELRNEPIRRLNERLGYQRLPDVWIVQGPLAGDQAAGALLT
jgi:GNAT superfamily N-acetyltransferase